MVLYKFDFCSNKIKGGPVHLDFSPIPVALCLDETLDKQTRRITSNAWSLDYTFSICKASPQGVQSEKTRLSNDR